MEHQLESRVNYFFSSRYRGRDDVRITLAELRKYGRLILVGGMLRDLALFGNAGFNSDLDFVVAPYDLGAFEDHMKAIGARTNRFGGYALPARKWQIDVWPLERTWAHVAGYTSARTLGDLTRSTFFRSDAIAYDLEFRMLKSVAGYFQDIENRVLEVNLRPNPNPKGNAVRAFRYALMKGFRWGPKLSEFIGEMIDHEGWDALQEAERHSFGTQYLGIIRSRDFSRALNRHISDSGSSIFDPAVFSRNVQLVLPYTR